MCGICGFVGSAEGDLLDRMTESLSHRGPDDFGYYRNGEVSLGHRRLSIIDIEGGSQPMHSPDGSLVIVFNGEIYNFRELRKSLQEEGHVFQTRSDTEVLLRLYQVKGPAALEQLNGMFAFAIHDKNRGELFLARDRIGIKPLYYVSLPGKFIFASESKSLLCCREWSPSLRSSAIHDYLSLRYVPGDTTMFKELKRLPAGHYLVHKNGRSTLHRYWRPEVYTGPFEKSHDEYMDEFAELMRKSVKRRLISDVPFGAYLSGGIDSSVIVALMSQFVSRPIKTFSVGFDYKHDELHEAAATARHLGCDHTEITCRSEDIALLPRILHHLDEPMGDAIIIPMYKLSRAAKKEVTVILTGEGGDEILGGYLFHKLMWLGNLYRQLTPQPIHRHLVTPLLSLAPAALLNTAFQYPAYLGDRGKIKALDYLSMLDPGMIDKAYRHLISLFDSRDTEGLYSADFKASLHEEMIAGTEVPAPVEGPYLNRLLHLQFRHWLPDNMLLRQDKTGMANGIEGRVPYLDHELVEFALKLPPQLKLRRLVGKHILRRYARGLLPAEVAKRKKMPFYVPVENYFQQKEFRDQVAELLSEESIRRRGIFNPRAVARLKDGMHRRDFMLVKQVFSLIVLEMWFRLFVDRTMRI